MRKKLFDLQIFTGEGGSSADTGSGGDGNSGQNSGSGATGGAMYSQGQVDQLAEARANLAVKTALSDYFKKQGVSEEEAAAALADFKAKKAGQSPDVAAVEKERDDALAKIAEMENTNYLRDKGVKADDLDYVLFKVSKNVDGKTDFKKAADAFLKGNPRFTGQGYKVVSSGRPDGGSGTGQTEHDAINAAIRSAFGR